MQTRLQRWIYALFLRFSKPMAWQFLHTFCDQSEDWIFSINNTGRLTWVNLKICKALNLERDAFIDKYPQQFLQFVPLKNDPLWQMVFSGKSIEPFELKVLSEKGDSTWVRISSIQIRFSESGHNTYYVVQNITARKQIERSQYREGLDKLKEINITNVSHELRTPIANIKLYNDLIRRNPAKNKIYADQIERESNRLELIVNDLLNFMIIEQTPTATQFLEINVNDLVTNLINDNLKQAESNNIDLNIIQEISLPPIYGNEEMLKQALQAVITNAINYTPENGRIVVSTSAEVGDEQTWIGIRVRDTGYGISDQDLPHIFEQFYRGEAGLISKTPGTGLGLANVKAIVSLHNGRLTVEQIQSEEGGTLFGIWLPLHQAE